MWRTFCISWCGVQYIVSSDVTYILFSRHTEQFLLRRTSCISWCDILPVFPAVEYNTLYHLVWRIYCSSDIHCIFCFDAHPILPYITYFLYFLVWSTTHCISWSGVLLYFLMLRAMHCIAWCGVYIVLQTYVTFLDMVCILYFPIWYFLYSLMWRTINSISWYDVYVVRQI